MWRQEMSKSWEEQETHLITSLVPFLFGQDRRRLGLGGEDCKETSLPDDGACQEGIFALGCPHVPPGVGLGLEQLLQEFGGYVQ